MDIEWIKEKVSTGEYEFRKHTLERGTLREMKCFECGGEYISGPVAVAEVESE